MPAVFVLPTPLGRPSEPSGAYLSTAGWASAAHRVLGEAWIVCPTGTIDVAEARRLGSGRGSNAEHEPTVQHPHVPAVVKTLAKDLRARRRAPAFALDPSGPWNGGALDFVWQRHELFHTAGIDLARRLGCPSVLFVPATKVWEANRWGTRRPGWAGIIENHGERPPLSRADVVACGSAEVAEQAERIGTPHDRIIITPSGVDLDIFPADRPHRERIREQLGIGDRFAVGWVGSFRPFHAVHRVVEAMAGIDGAVLLLVGDGPERGSAESLAAKLGVSVVTTGTVAQSDMAAYLSAMDVGLVLAPEGGEFHYSPLKLAEYMAAGLAVIAPRVDALESRLTDGTDAILVPTNDIAGLRSAIARLRLDRDLVACLGRNARDSAEAGWSWDAQVQRVSQAAAIVTPS